MLLSCFYNLITTSVPYRKGVFLGVGGRGVACQIKASAVTKLLFLLQDKVCLLFQSSRSSVRERK